MVQNRAGTKNISVGEHSVPVEGYVQFSGFSWLKDTVGTIGT